MLLGYQCTKCGSKWGIEKAEEVDDSCAQCPICSVQEVRNREKDIRDLKVLLKSYRNVFKDLGINDIPMVN